MVGKDHQRRYQRVALNLPAEIIINSIDIFDGTLIDVSPGDVAVQCAARVSIGDNLVVYAKGLDILPGRVVRLMPNGFAAVLILSKPHRQKLTERLFIQSNSDYQNTVSDRRSSPRHIAKDQRNVCRLPDGTTMFVKLIDISVNGAAVDATRKPDIGTAIQLGQRRGVVTRHTLRGFAIAFDRIAGFIADDQPAYSEEKSYRKKNSDTSWEEFTDVAERYKGNLSRLSGTDS